MKYFIGWHQPVNGPSGCGGFDYCMISVNRLIGRKSPFPVQNWIMDSGAFSRITSGKGHLSVKRYAKLIKRWSANGNMLAAVAQDYMCESFVLDRTGLTIADHQRLTVHRYRRLLEEMGDHPAYIMPVLQGYEVQDYLSHLDQYGDLLKPGMWVGIGSVCKRNASPAVIENLLMAIKAKRPDLRLHGFGIKQTTLRSGIVRELLYSADSQAHSFRPDSQGAKFRTANNPTAALEYAHSILNRPIQMSLLPLTLK